jgi:hypothetical protein
MEKMKLNYKHFTIGLFLLLLLILLFTHTTVSMCSVCGVQDYNRSIFGMHIELLSSHEIDETGYYTQWKKIHGNHEKHQWIEINEFDKNVLKILDSLN